MPLMHGGSKQAFQSNIKAEMGAGKPQKQALAIAYSMKKRAKKMNKGGEVTDGAQPSAAHGSADAIARLEAIRMKAMQTASEDNAWQDEMEHPEVEAQMDAKKESFEGFADGGMVDDVNEKMHPMHEPKHLVAKMRMARMAKMSQGGEVGYGEMPPRDGRNDEFMVAEDPLADDAVIDNELTSNPEEMFESPMSKRRARLRMFMRGGMAE